MSTVSSSVLRAVGRMRRRRDREDGQRSGPLCAVCGVARCCVFMGVPCATSRDEVPWACDRSIWRSRIEEEEELHYKNPPTPCLWQAPRKPKGKPGRRQKSAGYAIRMPGRLRGPDMRGIAPHAAELAFYLRRCETKKRKLAIEATAVCRTKRFLWGARRRRSGLYLSLQLLNLWVNIWLCGE